MSAYVEISNLVKSYPAPGGGESVIVKDFNLKNAPVWGFACHPLIDGNKLICMVGGPGSTVVAFDKLTGKELRE